LKPPQAFGVAVRVVGLLICLVAVLYLISAAIVLVNPAIKPGVAPPWQYLLAGVIGLALGLFLLRRARLIVALAYPPGRGSPDGPDDV
jgi:hypothetical protein